MGGMLRHAARDAANGIERLCLGVVGLLLAVLLAVVLASAGARYFAGSFIAGGEELALWLHGALVFLGLPLVSTRAGALRLGLLRPAGGSRFRRGLGIVADAVVVHALLVLFFGAWAVMREIGGVSITLGVPDAWRFAPVAAGAALALLLLALPVFQRRDFSVLGAFCLGAALYLFAQSGVLDSLERPSLLAGGVALGALFLGAPLPHALISGASLAIPFGAMLPQAAIVQNGVGGIGRFLLLAIPFFLLAGSLMQASGFADRLVRLARSLVGHWRGGMAQTTLATNLMISGLSGSSIADAAFGAKVLQPGLVKSGYTPARAAAIVAATAVLPNIVPPSVAFLILALATGLSVAALFAAGLAAGLLLAAIMAIALYNLSGRVAGNERAPRQERRSALLGALPALGLAVVIIGGIRFGIVTTTEAAAIAALYAFGAACIVDRGRGLAAVFAQTGREAASVGLLIASAAPFAFLLAVDDAAGLVRGLFAGVSHPAAVIAAANLILLCAGAFLDIGAAILLFAPLLMPIAVAAGIDPIHFGMILVVNLMIGGLTPPFGILVYVAARASGTPAVEVFRAVTPLVLWLLAGLAALSAFASYSAS